MRPGKRRSNVDLLRDSSFGPFVLTKILSSCAIWIQNVTAAILMFDLTGSAVMVGTVTVVQFAGPLIFAPWTGSLTDRVDRRKLIIFGRSVSAVAVSGLAMMVAICDNGRTANPRVLLAIVLVMGVGVTLSAPAMQAIVPDLVEPEDLDHALAMSSVAPSMARTLGPIMGAGLVFVGGPAASFAMAAAFHWIFVTVLLVRVSPRGVQRAEGRPAIFGGFQYFKGDRIAARLTIAVALLGFGADPVLTLSPSLVEGYGAPAGHVGFLVSAFGVGSIVTTMFFNFLHHRFSLRVLGMAGFVALAGGLVVTAFSTNVVAGSLGFVVGGVGYMMANVTLNARIQRRVPGHLRGRVMALWAVAFLGCRPFAAMLDGFLADLGSTRIALFAAAAITVCSVGLIAVRYPADSGHGDRSEPHPAGSDPG